MTGGAHGRRRPWRERLLRGKRALRAVRVPRPTWHGALLALTAGGLAAGGAAYGLGVRSAAELIWLATTALACVPAAWWAVDGLRHGKLGSDVIAVLALVGTLVVGEQLAGAIIAVMLTGGQALEHRASRRARRDLGALLSLAPRVAHRHEPGGLVDRAVEDVRPGDLLLVRAGEVVPVDGRVEHDRAVVDESMITGEAVPAEYGRGDVVRSGTVNAGAPFDLRAATESKDSTYAGIVRLAREAEASGAPFVRMADRYAAWFLPTTVVLAGLAWAVSADPVRAVAVLVVATPCPLILAAPIAFVSGLSRCARRGVVVKGGDVIERLARVRVVLFDKTGTVTRGRPELVDIVTGEGTDPAELLRLAASLDQVSAHVFGAAIVHAADDRALPLALPADVTESPGAGITGTVDGRRVAVGKAAYAAGDGPIPDWAQAARRRAAAQGAATVFAGVDGALAGVLLLEDRLRPDAARTFRLLRRAGIDRSVMITGDRAAVAAPIAALIGADAVHADQDPAGKVAVVEQETAAAPTVMVGDGVNDAPALAAAEVGVALGARGATASSEAADVVITVDRLERVAETLGIARRTRRIAWQSVLAGMAMSLAAMAVAAMGALPPAAGALLQELIDLAVILNALRALGPGRDRRPMLRGAHAELVRRLDEDHRRLWPSIDRLPEIADQVGDLPPDRLRARLREVTEFLTRDLAAHERLDEEVFYPAVARALGGSDPTGAMSRGHAEIATLTHRFTTLAEEVRRGADDDATRRDLRRVLDQLHAVLRLHFLQEEENYFPLAEERRPR